METPGDMERRCVLVMYLVGARFLKRYTIVEYITADVGLGRIITL